MTALARNIAAAHTAPAPDRAGLAGIVRVLTCGSVDDGKSTLLGRLLWDASDLFDDQRETLKKGRRVAGGEPDYSLLVDGLLAEREQGITIDIAWRYFDTDHRRFVVIDSPGHEQYTRNMASGASHADVALMLVDARSGIKRQTRRHAAILDLVGCRRVVLAVNKMDLVDWSEATFRAIEADFSTLTERFGFENAVVIPVSAVFGDNVATRSQKMDWYRGPTLLEHLDDVSGHEADVAHPFRFPVQSVIRDGADFRGLAGTIGAGRVAVGDPVVDVASGRAARVARIATFDGDRTQAEAGEAVVIGLDRDLDISRGAVLAAAAGAPAPARSLDAHLVWLSDQPFDTDHGYLLRTATDLVPVAAIEITSRLDLETLATQPAGGAAMNDIALATISLGRPAAIEAFRDCAETGRFVIVHALSGATVAGGIIRAAHGAAVETSRTSPRYTLRRDRLAADLSADLGDSPADRAEFERRARAVIALFAEAGISAELD